MAKKKKTIPLTGNVTLSTVRGRLEPDQVLEQYFDEDTELDEVVGEDREPAKNAKVQAATLWALLTLAVEGAIESVDPDDDDEDDDEDETDEWGLMPEQEDRLRSNLQRLREDYLTDRVFVTLMSTDLKAALHWYWDAVVLAPWFVDEDGEPIFDLGVIDDEEDDDEEEEDEEEDDEEEEEEEERVRTIRPVETAHQPWTGRGRHHHSGAGLLRPVGPGCAGRGRPGARHHLQVRLH